MVMNFMNKYRINIIYNSKGNINDIFAKVLSKELSMICLNKKKLLLVMDRVKCIWLLFLTGYGWVSQSSCRQICFFICPVSVFFLKISLLPFKTVI